ncbi:MAG: PadR family transcriptional regulator [Candidatus Helarchaeota archaeon]
MFRRGRSRQEISPIGMLVLGALKDKPLTGMNIIRKLDEEFSDTAFKAKTGTIYPLLEKLEKNEYIERKNLQSREKIYALTSKGKNLLANAINSNFKSEMAFSSRFFDFFLSTDFVDFISSMTKNVAEIGESIAGQFDHGLKDFKYKNLKADIRRLQKLINYHESQIEKHRIEIEKIEERIKRKQFKLEKIEKELEETEKEKKKFHAIEID